jgi:hypothetical protein
MAFLLLFFATCARSRTTNHIYEKVRLLSYEPIMYNNENIRVQYNNEGKLAVETANAKYLDGLTRANKATTSLQHFLITLEENLKFGNDAHIIMQNCADANSTMCEKYVHVPISQSRASCIFENIFKWITWILGTIWVSIIILILAVLFCGRFAEDCISMYSLCIPCTCNILISLYDCMESSLKWIKSKCKDKNDYKQLTML